MKSSFNTQECGIMTFSERRQNPGLNKDELDASLAVLAKASVAGLASHTEHHYRTVATNMCGTSYEIYDTIKRLRR